LIDFQVRVGRGEKRLYRFSPFPPNGISTVCFGGHTA
jgi:hypothetical protein